MMVCTANICRSPIAEALVRKRWELQNNSAGEITLVVSSCGFLSSGVRSPIEAVEAAQAQGVDISGHISTQISEESIAASDLILTMTRQHVIGVTNIDDSALVKTFTLKELVRRSESVRPALGTEEWLSRLNANRKRRDLLGISRIDDVVDPYGAPPGVYTAVAQELAGLSAKVCELISSLGSTTRR